jgi:flavin reductase (DIM6/NTAB) family NADH-FMN oxidoreductase RutF
LAQKEIDLSNMAPRDAHDLLSSAIIPRPIAWVCSVDADGKFNLAPFSFFSGVTWCPPTLSFSVVNRMDSNRKDTILNIEQTRNFTVNMVSEEMGPLMIETSVTMPRGVDEAKEAGVVLIDSTLVAAPRVKDAPVSFECELDRIIQVGSGPHGANLVLGRIKLMHVNQEILESEKCIDWQRARILGRLSGNKFCNIRDAYDIIPKE